MLARHIQAIFWFGLALAACAAPAQAEVVIVTATPSNTPTFTATASPTPGPSPTPTRTPSPSLTPTPECGQSEGTLTDEILISSVLDKQPVPYRLYLPPCYSTHTWQRYPVLYLIHGLNMTEKTWSELGAATVADALITGGEAPPFIIVMPRAPDDPRFTEAVVFDFVPFMDATHRTFADSAYRALGGMSRGGGWTVRIGLQYPGLFDSLGFHSLAIFFADEDKVVGWLNRLPDDKLPRIYMDIGQSDSLLPSATWFDEALSARFIAHDFIVRPGRHDAAYWETHLPEYLRWYTANWQ